MFVQINEVNGDRRMRWKVLVNAVKKPGDTYEDWAIMEALELFEEEDYDWDRVAFFQILEVVETDDSDDVFEVWGPMAEIYFLKVGEVVVILDGKHMMVNDFVVDVVVL